MSKTPTLNEGPFEQLVHLNVGGTAFTTLRKTLNRFPDTILANIDDKSDNKHGILELSEGTYFIDRNGHLFQHILDFLRTGKLILPKSFNETAALREEAAYYKLTQLRILLDNVTMSLSTSPDEPISRYMSISYRGTFAFGRNGQADVKFRKIQRILICGKLTLCREVFGDTLNESRDPDRGGEDRYTSRLYLKHNCLEQAFDHLADHNMKMVASSASGTSGPGGAGIPNMAGDMASRTMDTDEQRWGHYSVFVFMKQ